MCLFSKYQKIFFMLGCMDSTIQEKLNMVGAKKDINNFLENFINIIFYQ